MGPPHEGSIRRPIAPWANALTTELHLAPRTTMANGSVYRRKLVLYFRYRRYGEQRKMICRLLFSWGQRVERDSVVGWGGVVFHHWPSLRVIKERENTIVSYGTYPTDVSHHLESAVLTWLLASPHGSRNNKSLGTEQHPSSTVVVPFHPTWHLLSSSWTR